MFARFSRNPVFCTAFVTLALCACSMNLRPVPTQAADISGLWIRDADHSDDIAKELNAAFAASAAKQAQKRPRFRGEPEFGEDDEGPESGPPGAGSRSDGPEPRRAPGGMQSFWLRQQRRQEEELINAVSPPQELRITQSGGRVEMVSAAGGARRSFDPEKPSTLVTTYASLRMQSGWQGNVFVVNARDSEARLEITERYWLTPSGDLQKQMLIEAPEIKKQIYQVLFKRGAG